MRKRLNITLDELLYEKIKTLATNDHRSVSNKIECMLEEYVNRPGVQSTPSQPALHYPPGVRSPIPETPSQPQSQSQSQSQPEKPKRRTIIGGTSNKHPLIWLDENNIDPNDISETAYDKLHTYYPDVDIPQFVEYQHDRQNRYTPDPNDPFDPTINNPYLRNK